MENFPGQIYNTALSVDREGDIMFFDKKNGRYVSVPMETFASDRKLINSIHPLSAFTIGQMIARKNHRKMREIQSEAGQYNKVINFPCKKR